jgi:hypothetical protein
MSIHSDERVELTPSTDSTVDIKISREVRSRANNDVASDQVAGACTLCQECQECQGVHEIHTVPMNLILPSPPLNSELSSLGRNRQDVYTSVWLFLPEPLLIVWLRYGKSLPYRSKTAEDCVVR